jgi:phage virion morphogenesis protein
LVADTVTLDAFPAALAKLAAPPADLGPLLEQVAAALQAGTVRRFGLGVSPQGVGWAPLAASTRKKRRRRAGQPLQDTGRLLGSITTRAAPPASVTQTAGAPYAGFHQGGTRRIPARPFLGPSDEDVRAVAGLIADYWARDIARR